MPSLKVIQLFVLVLVVLGECVASPVGETQSSAEMLERLRKMVALPKRSRPLTMTPEPQPPPFSDKEFLASSTPTMMTPTMTPEFSAAEPVQHNEAPAPSSEETQSFVLVPVTDQNTINQVQNHVNNFHSTNDPYNQIQIVPFRPPPIGHSNNYLNYLNYVRNRQSSVVDRFTNFAGNFFPVEITVPDLIGSLTSWIPGASLIGSILTGNRPNTRQYAVLGGNGQVYIVDVPMNPIQPSPPRFRVPFDQPHQIPHNNFGGPFTPFMNQEGPFNNFFSRNSAPHHPEDFPQRFQNVPPYPFPGDYPGLQIQNVRHDFMESRGGEMEPNLNEDVLHNVNGFGNNPNVAILPNQKFNGNLHIPLEGLLFPRGRSMAPPNPPGVKDI